MWRLVFSVSFFFSRLRSSRVFSFFFRGRQSSGSLFSVFPEQIRRFFIFKFSSEVVLDIHLGIAAKNDAIKGLVPCESWGRRSSSVGRRRQRQKGRTRFCSSFSPFSLAAASSRCLSLFAQGTLFFCIITCCSGILSARTFRMSVSVERERDADDDGLIDMELELLENRIESAAAMRAPLRRLPLLPVLEKRPAARRRPVLASIVLRRGEAKEKKKRKSPLALSL